MKKLLTVAALVGVTIASFGQGQVTFINSATTLISTNSAHGGTPTGSITPYPGSGQPEYIFGLFVAPSTVSTYLGTFDPNWQNLVGYATNMAAVTGGRLSGGQPILPAPFASGTTANFLLRAWSAEVGGMDWTTVRLSSAWSGAASAPGQLLYISPIIQVTVGGGPNLIPGLFGPSVGSQFQGFTMDLVIPEPSSISLLTFGAAALLVLRRRNNE